MVDLFDNQLHVFDDAHDLLAVSARLTTEQQNVAIRLPYRVIDDAPDLFPGTGSRLERVRQALAGMFDESGEAALIASPLWRLGTALP